MLAITKPVPLWEGCAGHFSLTDLEELTLRPMRPKEPSILEVCIRFLPWISIRSLSPLEFASLQELLPNDCTLSTKALIWLSVQNFSNGLCCLAQPMRLVGVRPELTHCLT